MKGTTMGTAHDMVNTSKAGVRHGPNQKNVQSTAKGRGKPSGPTSPIKGMDKGGV